MPMVDYPDMLTYTTSDAQYHAKIITPKYFSAAGYIDYLRDSLNKIKFVDQRAVYEMVNLPMVKVIKEVTLADLQARIEQLEARIAACTDDGYECIETHEYPSWATYEEFMRLPGWKYFEAAENQNVDIMKCNDPHYVSVLMLRHKYEEHGVRIGYYEGNQIMFIQSDSIECDRHIKYSGYGYGKCNLYGIQKEHLLNIDYNYFNKCNTWSGKWPISFIDLFHKSINVYSVGYYVPFPIYQYALNYLIGWFLVNWKSNIGHEIYLTIDITATAIFNIYKKQKKIIKYMNPYIILALPSLKSVRINGIEYVV
jgi:hypothetical protein